MGPNRSSRERVRTLAQGFCTDLDKVATSELDNAAKKGSEDTTSRLKDAIKEAEEATKKLKAAADAAKPGFVNLTLTGDFDDQVTISINGKESAKTLEVSQAVQVKPGIQELKLTLA